MELRVKYETFIVSFAILNMGDCIVKKIIIGLFLFLYASAAGYGANWNIVNISTDSWLANNISFKVDDCQIFLNNTHIYQPGGSSAYYQDLHLNGDWGVCGVIDNGDFIADPFATFVIDNSSVPEYQIKYGEHGNYLPYEDVWTQVGHISWLPGTPDGYTAPILFGFSFEGDDAQTYSHYNPLSGQTNQATGTIVLEYNWPRGDYATYNQLSKLFETDYPSIPECPSYILGLTSLIFLLAIRRRLLLHSSNFSIK